MSERREESRPGEEDRPGMSGQQQYKPVSSSSVYSPLGGGGGGGGSHSSHPSSAPGDEGGKEHDKQGGSRSAKMPSDMSFNNSLDLLSQRKDLPEDLACFLLQQKQRQARLETTMRSFPTSFDLDQEKQDLKRKRGSHEDPLSHRVIEKRRRDRMNSCLADLSRLIPSTYTKKGRGRIEKTEIIEMAIKHMRHLQNHTCQADECDLTGEGDTSNKISNIESFRVGYHECLTETMHFLVEKEGLYAGDAICVRLINHLQKHYDQLGKNNAKLTREPPPTLPNTSKTWVYKPKEERSEEGVKSEISEESGYHSVKQEEEGGSCLNLSTHSSAASGSSGGGGGGQTAPHTPTSPYVMLPSHVDGTNSREAGKDADTRQEFYRRERKSSFISPDHSDGNIKTPEDMDQDMPSDLSKKSDDGDSNRYKFKSNIQKRFSQQDYQQTPGPLSGKLEWQQQVAAAGGSAPSRSSDQSPGPPTDIKSSGGKERQPHYHQHHHQQHHHHHHHHHSHSQHHSSKDGGGGGGGGGGTTPLHGMPYEVGSSSNDRYPQSSSGGGLSLDCDIKSRDQQMEEECLHPPAQAQATRQQRASPASSSSASSSSTPGVPIFALNSRGSYYVPMTVDLSVISPFMSLYREESCPILHPVTISVNFQSIHVDPRANSSSSRSTNVTPHTSVIKHWKDRGTS